ncbi:testis-expressed protein 2 isoform X2 [Ostrinia nubilalis]|uniref:testis-expressed protein 2 isoform X2 n=1 Tax=Ostrinia nubilalis TaxID=29057 RepID=UPI0030822F75
MEISGSGKSPNTSLSFRYNANNEELEELYNVCEDDPPTPQCDVPQSAQGENASPKRGDKTSSIIDKYFKSIRDKPIEKEKLIEKPVEKAEDAKPVESKQAEEGVTVIPPKEVSSSPMKEYFNRLGKRSSSEVEVKESNETWKIFHDFKFKIAQAVEDMKTRSLEETKEKSVPRENSTSDSEENSAVKDSDQQSVGDTDNQVSSLDSSIQNLSELTQPLTAKATEKEFIYPAESKNHSDSSDDTHKNIGNSDSADVSRDILNDSNMMEVESGVEALEDTLDGFGYVPNPETNPRDNAQDNIPPTPPPLLPSNFGMPPSKSNLHKAPSSEKPRVYFFTFTMYFLTFLLFINYVLFPNASIWNGFILGIWFYCLANETKSWVLDNYFSDTEPTKVAFLQLKRSSAMPPSYTIPSVKEHRPLKKYEGWINHYRFPEYDPYTYHINQTTTAFMKLEGCNLRISYTRTKIAKRALWDEKIENVVFYQHRLYNLTGARILLLPKGLVKRRQWSKKYPICIVLNEKEKIQVLEKENVEAERKTAEATNRKSKEQPEVESTETNTSPEKKRKFVWRRREKSISHSDGETGKEGLRHRLVRKMHRDKKADSTTTCTETAESQSEKNVLEESLFHDAEMDLATKSVTSTKDDDEEIDDNELSKIKEFLEEAVSNNGVSKRTDRSKAREQETGADGAVEGEWSVHVKRTTDRHSHLYLFARTGRDKHEWYRRLNTAVSEANAGSPDSSAAEEKTNSDPAAENKEGIEMAVYKLAEKETVAFAKTLNKGTDSITEGVTIAATSQKMQADMESYEKTFWPYLIKILQAKSPSTTCQCRMLPAEVTWVNTLLARLMYDVMRDPLIIARLQNRIQRKLNTLKLPSFMSPLVVTELSLSGACPLVERVAAPAWDERGVWLDADLRYDGGAYIALQTQLNLMKLKEKSECPTSCRHESPVVPELSLSGACPLVERVAAPAWDERGVWLDADLRYDGGAYIALQTQLNLMKLKEKNVTLEDQLLSSENLIENEMKTTGTGVFTEKQLRKRKPAIYDSEVEDSAESSSDDESPPVQPVDSTQNILVPESSSTSPDPAVSSKKKFLKMVDKIATNKYFQQVTDYKYVKRAMEGLSNTDIKLHLEIHGLEGRLAFNLPPPPHDRVWIGFRTNPQLVLKARPALGARTLRFAHISNWIEQKLSKEFEKVLVLPNMEDILIDVMTPTPVDYE